MEDKYISRVREVRVEAERMVRTEREAEASLAKRRAYRAGKEGARKEIAAGIKDPHGVGERMAYNPLESNHPRNAMHGEAATYMKEGIKSGDLNLVLQGAKMYARLSEDGEIPESVKRRLVKAFEDKVHSSEKHVLNNPNYYSSMGVQIEKFLESHRTKKRSLDTVAAGVISVAGLALSIAMISSNFTGYVVANMPIRDANLLGVFGFFLFLAAGFYFVKNK